MLSGVTKAILDIYPSIALSIALMNAVPPSALDRAILACGGAAKLAAAVGVSAQAVSQWRDRIPAERVIPIERATNGAVTRHELRPDLYPKDEAA